MMASSSLNRRNRVKEVMRLGRSHRDGKLELQARQAGGLRAGDWNRKVYAKASGKARLAGCGARAETE